MIKDKLKQFNINVEDIEPMDFNNDLISKIAGEIVDNYDRERYEMVLNDNLIIARDKFTGFKSYMGLKLSLEPLEKEISFIVRPNLKPSYETLESRIKEAIDSTCYIIHNLEKYDEYNQMIPEYLEIATNKANELLDRLKGEK